MLIIQHVDVCMFSNGKFKNVVALIDSREECPIRPGATLDRCYMMNPARGVTKNWIALEDSYMRNTSSLASTVVCNSPEERNVFAIYVSYYVKVKLLVGTMGSKISVKLPFTLLPSHVETELMAEHFPERYSPVQVLGPEHPVLESVGDYTLRPERRGSGRCLDPESERTQSDT